MNIEEKIKKEIDESENRINYYQTIKGIYKDCNDFIKAFEIDNMIKMEQLFINRLKDILNK